MMQSDTKKIKAKESVQDYTLNRGIEVMLPRARRLDKPSWLDRTFSFFERSVRVRIDIHRGTNGN